MTGLFYQVLGETTGLEIDDEAELMQSHDRAGRHAKREYDKIKDAIDRGQRHRLRHCHAVHWTS